MFTKKAHLNMGTLDNPPTNGRMDVCKNISRLKRIRIIRCRLLQNLTPCYYCTA